MIEFQVKADLQSAYDEQYTQDFVKWREVGGKYKAGNILELCQGISRHKVLEVGAGDGSILKFLDSANFASELYALEISKSGVEFIEKRELRTLHYVGLFDGYKLPFNDNYFDLVILSHVLEHVEFPRILLREIHRVSRYVVIEVPCDFSFDVDKRVKHFIAYGHINIFLPSVLRFMLRTESFEVVTDKLSKQALEVLSYNYFVNQGHSRSLANRLRLMLRFKRGQVKFAVVRGLQRELSADAYTVLCRKLEEPLKPFS